MADTTGITDEEILKRFSVAVHEMLADEDLAKAMPQEFTITPDLAMKLQPVFPEWRVSADGPAARTSIRESPGTMRTANFGAD